MSHLVYTRRPTDHSRRIFFACLTVALVVHLVSIFALRNERFFGMAGIRERTGKLFRVPVSSLQPPKARPHPQRLPTRADVAAAIQKSVSAAVAETLADLPPASVQEPPPASRLEEFAQAREAEEAPPRFEAPEHLDAVERSAEVLGMGAIREEVQVVARKVDGESGGAAITAATVASTQREGPVSEAAVAGRIARGVRPAAPATPRPVARPYEPRRPNAPPIEAAVPIDPTRRASEQPLEHGEPWDEFFDLVLSVYHPPDGGAGYFRLDVVPKAGTDLPVAARDVLFVLDASKSMGTERFANAQAAFAEAIRALHPDDRFTVVVFQTAPTWWRHAPQPASPQNKRSAVAWLMGVESEGMTDVYGGLAPALDAVDGGNRPVIVLICSDGRPTRGERDSRDLINRLTRENEGRASIYAFGAGSRTNRYLLDLLAYRNRGAAKFAVRGDEVGQGLDSMERSLRQPVLLRPQLRVSGAQPGSLYPVALSDIYAARALSVWGRLAPGASYIGVQLLGTSQGRPKEILAELPVPPRDTAGPELAQEWAYQKVFYLVGELTAHGRRPDITQELARLGRTYGLPEEYIEAARE